MPQHLAGSRSADRPRYSPQNVNVLSSEERKMKTKFWIPALLAATTFSASAFAQGGDVQRRNDRDDWRAPRQEQRRDDYRPAPRAPAYMQSRVIYSAPPVTYREPVVYRPMPVAYRVAPPLPFPPPLPNERFVAQTIGAVTGGFIGHQVGDGQIAPTLIGALIGGVIGNQIAR
jgi:hypothetical protein